MVKGPLVQVGMEVGHNTAVAGGAMLAAVACGEYATVQECADKLIWRNTNGKDIFIYELCSEKNDGLKSTIEIIDEAIDRNKMKHINIITQTIDAVNKLAEKENVYDNLSEQEKDMINKFKELYK